MEKNDVVNLIKDKFFDEVKTAFIGYDPDHDNKEAFISAIGSMVILASRLLDVIECDSNG